MLSWSAMRGLILHVLLYTFAVVAAFFFAEAKRMSASYNTIDYPFYVGFYAKAFDGARQAQHNINPQGLGVLGFHGTEGIKSFHQAIHLEPVKYLMAAFYKTIPDVRALQLAYAILFFLPVLYLWVALGVDHAARALFLSAVYVFFPSALQEATFDLRPFSLLAPCFLMLMVSIQQKRPALEQISLFVLLFCIREEGLILGAVAIAYSAALHSRHALRIRAVWVIPLLLWLVCLVLTVLYYRWTGYNLTVYLYRIKFIETHYRVMLPIIAAAGLALIAFFLYWWSLFPRARPAMTVAIYGAVVIMLAAQMVLLVTQDDDPAGWTSAFMKRLCGDRTHLFLSSVLPLVLVIQEVMTSTGTGTRRRVVGWMFLLSCLVVSTWPANWSPRATYFRYRMAAPAIAPLWHLRQNTDPGEDFILVDYEAFQVFCDYEYVSTYRRLPGFMSSDKNRYYPKNKDLLIPLIRDEVDYFAAATPEGKRDLATLIERSGIASKTLEDNGRVWIKQSLRYAGL